MAGLIEQSPGRIAQVELHGVMGAAADTVETEDAVVGIVDAGGMESHWTAVFLDAVIDPAPADTDRLVAVHLQQ